VDGEKAVDNSYDADRTLQFVFVGLAQSEAACHKSNQDLQGVSW